MLYGYHRKILHIDLTNRSLKIERPEDNFYRKYLGGERFSSLLCTPKDSPEVDPLGPENILILALSVLTGVPISGQSRMTAVAKSPQTGTIGDSQCGGFWPAEMKFAGYDAIVLEGKSTKPVYLWIHDGEAEVRDAEHLWGKETGEVEATIRQELNDRKIEVLQCGPSMPVKEWAETVMPFQKKSRSRSKEVQRKV